MNSDPGAGPARFGAIYAVLYLGTGAATPYLPVWLRSVGLSGSEIGMVLAAPMLARVATGPVVAAWADRFALRRTAPAVLAAVTAAALALMLTTRSLPAILLLWFVAGTALGTCSPLIDVIALRRARRDRFAYALPRGIGSAGYVVGNMLVGLLLSRFGPGIAVAGSAAAALASALAIRVLAPPDGVHGTESYDEGDRAGGTRRLLACPDFALLITTAALIQGANSYYYAFSTLLWRSQGLGTPTIGLLWGVGVGCEVAFLWCMEPWRRRIGPERLMVIAAAISTVRWMALSASPPLPLLWALQALHAFTLAAPFLASLQLVERVAPARDASLAQQLNAAFSTGLAMGAGTLAGGSIVHMLGGSGYLLMALMALIGLAGASLLSNRLGATHGRPATADSLAARGAGG